MVLVSQAISWGRTATTATTLTTLTTATTLFTLIFTSAMGSLTSMPRGYDMALVSQDISWGHT